MAEQAFKCISVNDWKNSCHHVLKIERDYYHKSQTLYDDIDRIILNLHDDSSTSDDTFEDSQQAIGGTSRTDDDFSGVEYLDESIFDSE